MDQRKAIGPNVMIISYKSRKNSTVLRFCCNIKQGACVYKGERHMLIDHG